VAVAGRLYWALGRTREKQDTAIAGSLNFGVYDSVSGAQLGYARVVTDQATFAWLCDVYIAPAARGKGLGTALTAAVCDSPPVACAASCWPPQTPTRSTPR
jgi:hypothetical protein